jgi:hypothetical protein
VYLFLLSGVPFQQIGHQVSWIFFAEGGGVYPFFDQVYLEALRTEMVLPFSS